LVKGVDFFRNKQLTTMENVKVSRFSTNISSGGHRYA